MTIPSSELLLEMEGIDKTFPGVRALQNARLDLRAGEVHALMGENGAGKSTLIKVLSGAHRPDRGVIRIRGMPAAIHGPRDAERAGIAVIYQEFNLVPGLTARENIFLGREERIGPFVRHGRERDKAAALFARMNVAMDPEALCCDLTVAQQQVVEIAKVIALDARIVVMDEPTAALTGQEVEKLFAIIAGLKARGVGILYVSHRMDEIFRIADRVTVMRDGQYVGTQAIGQLTREKLIEMMVGRKLENEFPRRVANRGEPRLVVEGLSRGTAVRDVSLTVRRGEVLGLAGLVGAGRTETARLIFGADRPDRGRVLLDGRELRIKSPADAIRAGICLLTEDRKGQGLVLGASVRENFGLPNLRKFLRFGFVRESEERTRFAHYVEELRIKVPHADTPAKNLSGGNQQKVVLAKWLETSAEVVIFDEPTRGIDVGTKYDIYVLINALAARGKAIVMISSELPEVLGMSDRILVMHEGRITGEIGDVARATQEQIMRLAMA
ncbi:MAG: sugar ABC transporter ATP-binding protein [Tepidisphaerales bacterium]